MPFASSEDYSVKVYDEVLSSEGHSGWMYEKGKWKKYESDEKVGFILVMCRQRLCGISAMRLQRSLGYLVRDILVNTFLQYEIIIVFTLLVLKYILIQLL